MKKKYIFLTEDSIFGVPTKNLSLLNRKPSQPFASELFSSLKKLARKGYLFRCLISQKNDLSLFYQLLKVESIDGLIPEPFVLKRESGNLNLLEEILLFTQDKSVDLKKSAWVHIDNEFNPLAQKLKCLYYSLQETTWPSLVQELISTPRRAKQRRVTRETKVEVEVNLDGTGTTQISTGLPFFDHVLEQIGRHGRIDLIIQVQGDLEVDEHHTVEDTAIVLGQVLREALGDKRGIRRYSFLLPMDEVLVQCALDLSGRSYLIFNAQFTREKVGDLPTELVKHFYRSLCDHLGANLNLNIDGENDHHKIEGSFKAFAKCLKEAILQEGDYPPSTKGVL